jgi:hypothetical protein
MEKIYVPILLFIVSIALLGIVIKNNFVDIVTEPFFNTAQCGSITNCTSCADKSGCVWCLNKQVCVPTNRFGMPLNRECQDPDIASFPSNCRNSSSTNNIIGTTTLSDASGNGIRAGIQPTGSSTTYDTSDFTQAYYQQFYNNPTRPPGLPSLPGRISESTGMPDISGSRLFNVVENRYQTTCPDYTRVESSIKTNLGSNIRQILSSELTRNGLRYIEGFGTLETTGLAVQASINDDIKNIVRKSIIAKANS